MGGGGKKNRLQGAHTDTIQQNKQKKKGVVSKSDRHLTSPMQRGTGVLEPEKKKSPP